MDVERILIAGAGFLADAYDLFVINVAVDMMSKCNYNQILTDRVKSNIKTTALIGAIFGQLFFGSTADIFGRRKVFIITCSLVILGATLSATVINSTGFFVIYSQLCLWRFLLGVGVGGEYPLSAAVTSESCNKETRLKSLACVFSMQGFGTFLCALVLVTLSQTLGDNYDLMWRLALGIGGVPMIIAFYFRWRMHESKTWERDRQVDYILLYSVLLLIFQILFHIYHKYRKKYKMTFHNNIVLIPVLNNRLFIRLLLLLPIYFNQQ